MQNRQVYYTSRLIDAIVSSFLPWKNARENNVTPDVMAIYDNILQGEYDNYLKTCRLFDAGKIIIHAAKFDYARNPTFPRVIYTDYHNLMEIHIHHTIPSHCRNSMFCSGAAAPTGRSLDETKIIYKDPIKSFLISSRVAGLIEKYNNVRENVASARLG